MAAFANEAVEAAALAIFNDEWRPGDWKWDQYGSDSRYHYRARVALEAAAPHLTPRPTREQVLQAIGETLTSEGMVGYALDQKLTDAVIALLTR